MASVYRKACIVAPEKKITLTIDGDALDESETVKGLGLENDDVLDVTVT